MADIETIAPPVVMSRDEVLATLRRHTSEIRGFGATALYLFGSAARDEMTAASDVDVFIDFDHDGSFSFVEWIELKEYLANILRRDVDFTSRGGLHPRLRDRIIGSAIQVY